MNIINNIASTLFRKFEILEISETNQQFDLSIKPEDVSDIKTIDFSNLFSLIPSRDNLELIFFWGTAEPIFLNKLNFFEENVKKDLISNYDIFKEDLKFRIKIEKYKRENCISIYSLDDYVKNLNKYNLVQKLDSFKAALSDSMYIKFIVYDKQINYYSKSISFINEANIDKFIPYDLNRSKRLDKIKNSCHLGMISTYDFLPEDYLFSDINQVNSDLIEILSKIRILLSICSIFDYTDIQDNTVKYRLNGYKAIYGIITYQDIEIAKHEIFYEIYLYVYEDGSISDKIGLARNMITIHVEEKNKFILKENILDAIKSGYEIYLKENIKQYIEVRNNISDQLLEFSKKANEIAEDYSKDFHKTFIAFISFFASVIVIRLINKPLTGRLFNDDIAILTYVFLFFSCLYLLLSLNDLRQKKIRYKNNLANLKARYTDLLTEADINKIVNNDKEYYDDINYINKKRNYTTALWLLTFLILGFVTAYLASWICV